MFKENELDEKSNANARLFSDKVQLDVTTGQGLLLNDTIQAICKQSIERVYD